MASASRPAGVPRSWLRRALKRAEYRTDIDGRLDPLVVPKIREAHRWAVSRRERWKAQPKPNRGRIDGIDNLVDSIDALGSHCDAVTPDELEQLVRDCADPAYATEHPTWARAMRGAANALKPRPRRVKKEITP